MNITCSVPEAFVLWISHQFHHTTVFLNPHYGSSRASRLDGAVTFIVNDVSKYNSSSCITSTATFANIQESMQGLRLSCTDGVTILSAVVIDVVGKLHLMTKIVLSF